MAANENTARKARLDQALLNRMAERTKKTPQYLREQTSRRASRLGITSEAAQVLWAKELGIGTAGALRRLPPHMQEQIQGALPGSNGSRPKATSNVEKSRGHAKQSSKLGATIDYLLSDAELRGRCKDLLQKGRHLDRVLREATTVLENRIKRTAGLKGSILPEQLVNVALNADPSKAILLMSDESNEQAGFRSICRGIVLAFRHRAHHNIDDGVTPQDALKFCGFIDVLLGFVGKAKPRRVITQQT
jgi:hypothetical protein